MATNYVCEANLKEFFNSIYKKEAVTIEDNSIDLYPNREYECQSAISTLSITFAEATSTYSSEYIISFTTGASGANITFPDNNIAWAGGIVPDFSSLSKATCLLCFIPLGDYMLGTWVAIQEEE